MLLTAFVKWLVMSSTPAWWLATRMRSASLLGVNWLSACKKLSSATSFAYGWFVSATRISAAVSIIPFTASPARYTRLRACLVSSCALLRLTLGRRKYHRCMSCMPVVWPVALSVA